MCKYSIFLYTLYLICTKNVLFCTYQVLALKISINFPILHRRFAAFVVGTTASLCYAGGSGFGNDVFDGVRSGKR